MNDLRQAAQQALEALEWLWGGEPLPCKEREAIAALKAALAEPELAPAPGYCKHCKQYTIEEPLPAEPVQEPVAWYLPSPDGDDSIFRDHRTVKACTGNKWEGFQPLYTAPPQRKPLSFEQILALHKKYWPYCEITTPDYNFARAIERAHGIK